MPNRMIYISTNVAEKFDKESNKSGLVNELLGKHYGQVSTRINNNGHVYVEAERAAIRTDEASAVVMGIITPVAASTERVSRPEARSTNGVCKIHGTPLTDNGKCLQKGCKYS